MWLEMCLAKGCVWAKFRAKEKPLALIPNMMQNLTVSHQNTHGQQGGVHGQKVKREKVSFEVRFKSL